PQGALRILTGGKIDRLVRAAIPEHDRAAAVLAAWDHAFEGVVLDRMILDFDGEAACGGIEARSLGDGPAPHDAGELEPEIVMEMAGGVLLNDEAQRPREAGHDHAPARLRGHVEVAFTSILGEFPSDRGRCGHR